VSPFGRSRRRQFGRGAVCIAERRGWRELTGAQEHRFGGVSAHHSSTGPGGRLQGRRTAAGGRVGTWSCGGRTGQWGGAVPAGPPHSRPPAKGHGAGRSARLSWGWAHYPWTAGGGACLCVDLAMNGHSHNRLYPVLLSPQQAAGRDRQPPVSGEPGRPLARPERDRTDWPKLR
jgi:hypothetical protein